MSDENAKLFDVRHFTAKIKSPDAKLYFLKREDLETYLGLLPDEMVQNEVNTRMMLLQRQIDTLHKVAENEN